MKKTLIYTGLSLFLFSYSCESTKMDLQSDSNYEAVIAEVAVLLEEGIIDQAKRDELVDGYMEIHADSLKQQAEYLEMVVELKDKK